MREAAVRPGPGLIAADWLDERSHGKSSSASLEEEEEKKEFCSRMWEASFVVVFLFFIQGPSGVWLLKMDFMALSGSCFQAMRCN